MNKTLHKFNKGAEVSDSCADPEIREQLAEYINSPLADPSAAEIENHLLECRHCREFFVTMLNLRKLHGSAEKRRARNRRKALKNANVINLADFREEWP